MTLFKRLLLSAALALAPSAALAQASPGQFPAIDLYWAGALGPAGQCLQTNSGATGVVWGPCSGPASSLTGLGTGVATALAQAMDSLNGLQSGVLTLVADTTGATPLDTPMATAIATGLNIHIPQGTYTVNNWIDMTKPGQRIYCDGPATTITAVRPSYNPTPMLIFEPAATDAVFEGCTLDHNGPQYLGTGPYVPLVWNNTTTGSHTNDGLGNAVLVMADRAKFSGVVKRGWDNCIGLALFNLTTGAQTSVPAPNAPVVTKTTTSYCGDGVHSYTPNYFQGAGVDVLTAAGATVSDSVDWYSYDGFWIDTSGGASANFSNLTAFYTQMSNTIFGGGWLVTPGGVGFYLSGANINFNGSTGSTSSPLATSSCVNCTAIMPQGQGLVIDTHSNSLSVTNFRAVRPGLQCIWDKSGQTRFTNTYCDSANNLSGYTGISPGTAAPQTAAIQIDASNTGGVTAQFQNTMAEFDGLTVFNAGTLNYSYAIGTGVYGANPTVVVTGPSLTAGTAGTSFVSGGATVSILDPTLINSASVTSSSVNATTLTANSVNMAHLVSSNATPTISSGFGASPGVASWNGTAAFRVIIGTGGTASTGVINLNATAAAAWVCSATDTTTNSATVFVTKAIGTATTVALTNYNTSGAAAAWVAGDVIAVQCSGD